MNLDNSDDPADYRAKNLAWFGDAKFGLFLHYGLYSLFEGRWENSYVDNKGAEWILPEEDVLTLREVGRRLREKDLEK